MRKYFYENARAPWHYTNECLTKEAFLCVNGTYPGSWAGEIQRVEGTEDDSPAVVAAEAGPQHAG